MLVLTGLGVLREVGLSPAPAPAPTRPPTTPAASSTPEAWPLGSGLPAGTLYVLATAGLYTVDVSSGLVTTTNVRTDASDTKLTPMADGVLVWTTTGSRAPRLLAYGSRDPLEPGGGLGGANSFLPGPDGRVWAAKLNRREPSRHVTWRLVDDEGRVGGRAEIRGVAVSDGADGLFGDDDVTLAHVFPAPPQRWREADLMATGPDGFELVRCADDRCPAELHDRRTGAVTPAAAASIFAEPGALSPGNRFLARVDQGPDDDEINVSEAASGALRRTFPSGGYAITFTWLSERWLVATSERGLVLYDAVDDVLLHPALPVDAIFQLVWRAS